MNLTNTGATTAKWNVMHVIAGALTGIGVGFVLMFVLSFLTLILPPAIQSLVNLAIFVVISVMIYKQAVKQSISFAKGYFWATLILSIYLGMVGTVLLYLTLFPYIR